MSAWPQFLLISLGVMGPEIVGSADDTGEAHGCQKLLCAPLNIFETICDWVKGHVQVSDPRVRETTTL